MTAPSSSGSSAGIPVRTRVLLVEDHPMIREGMRALLQDTDDFTICAEAASPEDALAALQQHHPDVVCLDLMLGTADGIPLIRALREDDPTVRILVLSVRDEEAFAERCLQAGALGYAMKTEPNDVLLAALRRVATGQVHLSPRAAMTMLAQVPRTPSKGRNRVASLTERELQVFQLIGLGWSTRQIGEKLGIGIKTVETHRENIKNKLRLEHSTALMREATMWVRQSS